MDEGSLAGSMSLVFGRGLVAKLLEGVVCRNFFSHSEDVLVQCSLKQRHESFNLRIVLSSQQQGTKAPHSFFG